MPERSRALALPPPSQAALARTVPPGDALRDMPGAVMAGLLMFYGISQAAQLLRLSDQRILQLVKSLPEVGEKKQVQVRAWLHAQRAALSVPVDAAVLVQAGAEQAKQMLSASLAEALRRAIHPMGMAVEDLAARSGTTAHVVQRLLDEGEDAALPSLDLLVRLAGGIGMQLALVPATPSGALGLHRSSFVPRAVRM